MVATDTWVSMGQEEEAAKRIKDYEGYQVNNPPIFFVRRLDGYLRLLRLTGRTNQYIPTLVDNLLRTNALLACRPGPSSS